MAEETTIIEGIMDETAPVVDDTITSPDGETTTPAPGDTGEGGKVVVDDKGEAVFEDAGKKKDEPVVVDETTRRLDELEKANKGLLKELGKERGKRQNFEGRLGQVNDFLATVEEKRSNKGDAKQLPPEPQAPDYLNIEFDSNDVPRIPLSVVKDLIKQQLTPVHEEIIQGKKIQASGRKIDGIRAEAQKVIAGNEAYPAAMQTLEQQWQWISREFGEYAKENNVQPKSQDDAEDMIFESGIDAAFSEQFPDADFDSVVGAYMLPEKATAKRAGLRLRKALKVIAGNKPAVTADAKATKESLDQAKKLAGKSNFTGAPNRKQSGTSLTQIADLPIETLLSLNEKEENQLYDLMGEE